jgi:hypothetical protein
LLDSYDFQHLGRYEAYGSLVAGGAVQPFASLTTRPLPESNGNADRLRELSRAAYGIPVNEIDSSLSALWSSSDRLPDGAVGSRRRSAANRDGETS